MKRQADLLLDCRARPTPPGYQPYIVEWFDQSGKFRRSLVLGRHTADARTTIANFHPDCRVARIRKGATA